VTSAGAEARNDRKIRSRKPGFFDSSRKQRLLLGLLLAVATLTLYYPVSGHPFLNYDDDLYIVYNPHVHAGLQWATVAWAFTSFNASNWHPLTWLSHALDYQLFQLNPAGHHVVSLLLHVLNVVLLFWVLQRATGCVYRSAMVATLFALHPINVESVAWIAERKNLLSMMFFLLALAAYHWYAHWVPQRGVPHPSRRRGEGGRIGRYFVVAVLFAMGLMAKPQVITLPFVLLLWDYWPLRRMFAVDETSAADAVAPAKSFSWLVLEKLPLLALSVVSAIVTVVAQREAGAMSGPHWQPFPIRIENAIVSYARYLGKAVWPSQLSLLYPHPGSSLRSWQVLAALALLLAINALVVAERHRHRYLLVGWFWFLGTLVPMIGFVQVGVQAMADRYAYLPFVGLFIMAVWAVADLLAEWRVATAWQAGVGLTVLLTFAIVARQQLDYWSNNVKLWSRVAELESQPPQSNPDNWVAGNNLGHALLDAGQEEEAILHFHAAVAINPSDPDSTLSIGAYQQGHGDFFGAIEQYKKVIAMTQRTARLNAVTRARAFRNMGHAYRQLGDYADARDSFRQAVELNPGDGESWLGLGITAHKLGDLSTAIPAYSQALKVESLDWVYVLMAKALEQSGRKDEAAAAMQKASLLSKNSEQAQRVAEKVLAQ
jgi:protein O-mannosyl-transferase